MNEIFNLRVVYEDINNEMVEHTKSIFSLDSAVEFAFDADACDNVREVDIISTTTGEILLSLEDGQITWLA